MEAPDSHQNDSQSDSESDKHVSTRSASPMESLEQSATKPKKSKKKKKTIHDKGGVQEAVNKILRKTGANAGLPANIVDKLEKKNMELKLEDLDEDVLRERLVHLEKELQDYREKCSRYKSENEWYRSEIETCKRESVDYVAFLEAKKNEKQSIIQDILDRCRQETEIFMEGKRQREQENQVKINGLKKQIEELEMKLEAKQQEIMHLADIMVRRVKYESEINKIKKEMETAEEMHRDKVSEVERKLLETRMKLQREADNKVKEMENAAHEKAAHYVLQHTQSLEKENKLLEVELRKMVLMTQDLLVKKDWLQQSNESLQRELKIREQVVGVRLNKIGSSIIKNASE